MRVPMISRSVRHSSLIVFALASCVASASTARASGGTVSFSATISGKSHDHGGFSQAVQSSPAGQPLLALLFVGCAVVKQAFGSDPATYQLQVRTTGEFFPGSKPTEAGVNFTIDNFRPGGGSRTYAGVNVSGTFAVNGHSYGDGSATIKSTARVSNGGLSGTWSDSAAVRVYPAKGISTVSGFQFRATWHCTSLFHITMK